MIPVVFNCDNNYVMPTCVLIISILKNNDKNENYEFNILLSEKITDEGRYWIDRLKTRFSEVVINLIEANKYIKKAVTHGSHITASTYLRLFIPQILQGYEKCIYLDCDLIVNCDLSDLYKIDMQDYLIAGIKEYGLSRYPERIKPKEKELSIPSVDQYVNAAVLLMNLDKFREKNLCNLFAKEIQKDYEFQDQDILNKHCYGHIKFIPLRFNLFNRHIDAQQLLDRSIYSEEDIKETVSENVIIHFPGKNKPWIFPVCKGGEIWWSYADEFLTAEEKNQLLYKAAEYQKSLKWESLRERCDQYNVLIIWGYSQIGKYVVDTLQKNGYDNIKGFGDNDKTKIGKIYKGIKVFSCKELSEYKDALFINTSQLAYNTITKQLVASGIKKQNIYIYKHKGKTYYKSIVKSEYEYELQEIYYREFGYNERFENLGYEGALKEITENEQMKEMKNTYFMEKWLLIK